VTENVNLNSTTTALAAVPKPALAGQTVTLTATISPTPTGSPLGTVSFYDGATLIGTGSVNSSGVATLTTSALPAGTDPLTVVYSGNSGFAGSTSSSLNETVNLNPTTTSLAAAPNPSTVGQAVVFTATVSPIPTGSPRGTVNFFSGLTLLGSGNVNSSGVATFSISNLAAGPYTITATYSGNAGFASSTSSGVDLVVDGKPHLAMPREIQRDHIHNTLIHVDFLAVSRTEKIAVDVPVIEVGDAAGVKEGGVVEHHLRDLHIESLPQDVPEHIEVDITELNIGDMIHVRDVVVPVGVTILTNPDDAVLSVITPAALRVEAELGLPGEEVPEAVEVPLAEGEEAPAEEGEGAPAAEEGGES
jgi:ribosomal protein bL25 (Ctc-form)